MRKMLFILPVVSILFYAFSFTYDTNPWVAPASAKKITNPITNKASSAKKGKSLFKTRCVVCHGDYGKGDGAGGKALNPKPANLTSLRVQKQTDGEIYWKISNGKGAMIKWDPILSKTERWNLVNFIRTIDARKK